jgi:hypothetical protein
MLRLFVKSNKIVSSVRLNSKTNLSQQRSKFEISSIQQRQFAKTVRVVTPSGVAEDTGDFIIYDNSPGATGKSVMQDLYIFLFELLD